MRLRARDIHSQADAGGRRIAAAVRTKRAVGFRALFPCHARRARAPPPDSKRPALPLLSRRSPGTVPAARRRPGGARRRRPDLRGGQHVQLLIPGTRSIPRACWGAVAGSCARAPNGPASFRRMWKSAISSNWRRNILPSPAICARSRRPRRMSTVRATTAIGRSRPKFQMSALDIRGWPRTVRHRRRAEGDPRERRVA